MLRRNLNKCYAGFIVLLFHLLFFEIYHGTYLPKKAAAPQVIFDVRFFTLAKPTVRDRSPKVSYSSPVIRSVKTPTDMSDVDEIKAQPVFPSATKFTEEPPEPDPFRLPKPADQDMLTLARKQVGKIDRELRQGKPAVPEDQPITRFQQFAEAVASAYIDKSVDARRWRFETPDGIAYTAMIISGKKRCYMSGPVNSIDGKSGGPSEITCPKTMSGWSVY